MKSAAACLLLLALLATIVDARILYRQTNSTKCSDFKQFNRGKGSKVGGETCVQNDGALLLTKPAISERAELHGLEDVTFEKGKKYYIKWEFMLNSTVSNNAIFQWKAYGSPMLQNFPVIISFSNGVMNLIQFQDPNTDQRSNVLFRKKISANQWYSHMVAISVSDETKGGTVEYWYDGVQQDLLLHGDSKKVWPSRTFDGSSVDAKFGIYGAYGTDVESSFRNLLIGETLEDMNYDRPGSSSSKAAGIFPEMAAMVLTTATTLYLIKELLNL